MSRYRETPVAPSVTFEPAGDDRYLRVDPMTAEWLLDAVVPCRAADVTDEVVALRAEVADLRDQWQQADAAADRHLVRAMDAEAEVARYAVAMSTLTNERDDARA